MSPQVVRFSSVGDIPYLEHCKGLMLQLAVSTKHLFSFIAFFCSLCFLEWHMAEVSLKSETSSSQCHYCSDMC